MISLVFGAAPGFASFTVLAFFADFYLSCLLGEGAAIRIVGGGDSSVDELAERYAHSRRLAWRRASPDVLEAAPGLPADATHLIVFWDGRAGAPARLITAARRRGVLCRLARL